MNVPHELTAFSLRDVAGDSLLQETPYPVVAPRNLETLTMLIQYARIEGLKVMVLGTGSSFADNFRLTSGNVVAVMMYRLSGVERLSPMAVRILGGTPVERVLGDDTQAERKTIGGLIAGAMPGRSPAVTAVLSRLLAIEIVNAEAQVVRMAAPNVAHAGDPGLAGAFIGSRGRLGVITALEVFPPLPIQRVARSGENFSESSLSAHDAAIRHVDAAGVMDPDGLFGW